MKKIIFLFLLFCIQNTVSYAQSWFNLRNRSDALNANSTIFTICTDTTDNIYAAGTFTDSTPGYGHQYVAKWDASTETWSKLGTGSSSLNANNAIHAICSDNMGNLYASGDFTNGIVWPSGNCYVAKWDGTSWNEMGTLNADGSINSICTDKYGNIYAAGNFRNTYGRYYVAKWNGSVWSDLGNLNANLYINAICVDDSQNVYAGGNFTDSTGKAYVSKYSPITGYWSEVGTGFDSSGVTAIIDRMFTDTPGHVCVAINFGNATHTSNNIFKWNGSSWSQLGALNGTHYILTICKGDSGFVYASGSFTNASGEFYVAKYDPGSDSWGQLGNLHLYYHDMKAEVSTMCTDKLGHLYAAGGFTDSMSPSNNFKYVAKYGIPPASLDIVDNHPLKIEIYPNPAQDYINIKAAQIEGLVSYRLYNAIGVLCKEGILSDDTPIDISDLMTGMYYLIVKNDYSQTAKIIKN